MSCALGRVDHRDIDGQEKSFSASGWLARIIQHELDHLDGILFTDRLSPADKMRVKTKLEELEQRYANP